ncbi:hypothetical protein HWD31_gp48 [Pantoea phage vB_PagM_SSEM1]|uniref:Uncharacterized protein n=1 Tax=Pantoea phage vB_PagM_SSEM1 TaxID=2721760 RepID=A0A6H0DBS1_9CAUD|nr:hypothetical protein HWD31_gp48 [Pantoea phage vB_PagM_SSEM1]QIS79375.1 hypothetical protein SSEM1_gp48 [Pantoea phage vB_PagM_SSEM1]
MRAYAKRIWRGLIPRSSTLSKWFCIHLKCKMCSGILESNPDGQLNKRGGKI